MNKILKHRCSLKNRLTESSNNSNDLSNYKPNLNFAIVNFIYKYIKIKRIFISRLSDYKISNTLFSIYKFHIRNKKNKILKNIL